MSDEPEVEGLLAKHDAIVEVRDETGRLVERKSFESHAEAKKYATIGDAKGYKAKVSSLDPKPKEAS